MLDLLLFFFWCNNGRVEGKWCLGATNTQKSVPAIYEINSTSKWLNHDGALLKIISCLNFGKNKDTRRNKVAIVIVNLGISTELILGVIEKLHINYDGFVSNSGTLGGINWDEHCIEVVAEKLVSMISGNPGSNNFESLGSHGKPDIMGGTSRIVCVLH